MSTVIKVSNNEYPILDQYLIPVVYGLVDPISMDLKYIGKTLRGVERIRNHFSDKNLENDGNTRKANWLRKLKKSGLTPIPIILYQHEIIEDLAVLNDILYTKEQSLINTFKDSGIDLLNHTDGGPGCVGRVFSLETRKKMSIGAKKRRLPDALIKNQAPMIDDLIKVDQHLRYCSKCKEYIQIKNFRFIPKANRYYRVCRSCHQKHYQKSRAVPGARLSFSKKVAKSVVAKNILNNETIEFWGIRPAARSIGGKCNKVGIVSAIKKQTPYYGYMWSYK